MVVGLLILLDLRRSVSDHDSVLAHQHSLHLLLCRWYSQMADPSQSGPCICFSRAGDKIDLIVGELCSQIESLAAAEGRQVFLVVFATGHLHRALSVLY